MDDSPRVSFFNKVFRKKDDNEIENEIVSMLNEGQEQGEILESEAEMITNIFEFDETLVSDIMIHRKNISFVDGQKILDEVMDYIVEENYSRFPVYDDNIDNIIGIIHIKDAIKSYMNGQNRHIPLKDIDGILQKAYFIPETSKINSVFTSMKNEKIHMQIVVDEYGQTSGIVCMEDILEEIVGNIFDEHDEIEYNIVKVKDGVYDIKGLTPLEEITDEIGIEFDSVDYDTLNGYLISKIDRIPENDEGTVIKENGIEYRIVSIEDKIIAMVQVIVADSSDK